MEASRDGTWLRVNAPAKLNLFLEILAKRSDGFHELETLMTAISISDTLLVSSNTEGRIRLSCNWAFGFEARCRGRPANGRVRHRRNRGGSPSATFGDLPTDTNNLAYRAAEELRRRSGEERGATIHLVKRIPSAAGLGGASSDAAAVLSALNRAWRLAWPAPRLAEVAADIGSDVPFFVMAQENGIRSAWCRGRGERIEPEPGGPLLHVVLVKPPVGLSTAAVYSHCTVPRDPRTPEPFRQAWNCRDSVALGRQLFNRLQEAAEPLCDWVERLRAWFDRSDVLGHQMSGSGTAYFGLCRHARQARHVAARLRNAEMGEVFYATTQATL